MRAWPIELTKSEFDNYFYRYVTNVCADGVPEHLVSLRLVEKIQDPEVTERHDPPQEEIDEKEGKGELWWPKYKLSVPSHEFMFEEDEKRLVLKRLDANIGHVPPGVAAQFEVVRQKVITAEPIDLTPDVEAPDADARAVGSP